MHKTYISIIEAKVRNKFRKIGRFAEPPGGAKRRFSIDSPNGLSTENGTVIYNVNI